MESAPIPPADYEPLVEEHKHLRETLSQIRKTIAERQAEQANVSEALSDLAGQLKSHFAHEEEERGFFDVVVDQEPRLRERADVLISEHADLAERLDKLQWHAQQGVPSDTWWNELATRYDEFLKVFSRHEHDENDLVQTAFTDDIGDKD